MKAITESKTMTTTRQTDGTRRCIKSGTPATWRHAARALGSIEGVEWVQTFTGGYHDLLITVNGDAPMLDVVRAARAHGFTVSDTERDGDDAEDIWFGYDD